MEWHLGDLPRKFPARSIAVPGHFLNQALAEELAELLPMDRPIGTAQAVAADPSSVHYEEVPTELQEALQSLPH